MKSTLICFLLLFLLLGVQQQLEAQNQKRITGTVRSSEGNALSGASITEKGKTNTVISSETGSFSMSVSSDATIVISHIGYITQELAVGNQTDFSITLLEAVNAEEEVVVTALGLSRQSKTLTYTTQQINGDDLTTVKTPNLLNSLNGKVAGVQLNKTSGGAGGSVRITIRGDKSTRSSQPLFVIDGMPLLNTAGNAPTAQLYNNMPDQGDVLSTINQEDIESINFLKGASASALYGSAGSNGVVVITTKKGKAGRSSIDFSSGLMMDNVFDLPKLQFDYNQTTIGTTAPGSKESWATSGSNNTDHVKPFFKTGLTWINSVGVSSGNDKNTIFFSYSNTTNNGVLPNTSFGQNNLNLRTSSKLFDDRLTLDFNMMGSLQHSKNRLTPGIYFNPLTGLYLFPRGLNFESYADNYEVFSQGFYRGVQNWWNINPDKGWGGDDNQQNPNWILHRNQVTTKMQTLYASAAVKYKLSNALSVQARGNINNVVNRLERNIYASTQSTLSGAKGRFAVNNDNATNVYGDLLLLGNTDLSEDFTLGFTVGTSILDQRGRGTQLDASNLLTANSFMESNVDWTITDKRHYNNTSQRRQVQSLFGSVQIGYQNKLFLELTDRNDWSSTLAFTPHKAKGFNYYSVGASAVLSEMIAMPSFLDFAKLRASYAIVGNDIEYYRTYPLFKENGTNLVNPSSVILREGYYLQPEKNKTFEIGFDVRMLSNRMNLNFTWYKTNITNQFLKDISVPPGLTESAKADVNGGNVENKGFEIVLSYKAVENENFSWTPTLNISTNKNKVVELFNAKISANTSPDLRYELPGGNFLVQGGSFGDFYDYGFLRDNSGNIVVDAAGKPQRTTSFIYLGNPNPTLMVGLNNQIRFKDVMVSFLIDGKFGSEVRSMTEPYFDLFGVSKRSGDNRAGVSIPNAVLPGGGAYTGKADAKDYYQALSTIPEAYIYSGDAVRLRELAISYKLPIKSNTLKNLSIGFTGSNLFFLSKKAPFDPEQVTGVNAGGNGVDVFGMPPVRSFGFNLKCNL